MLPVPHVHRPTATTQDKILHAIYDSKNFGKGAPRAVLTHLKELTNLKSAMQKLISAEDVYRVNKGHRLKLACRDTTRKRLMAAGLISPKAKKTIAKKSKA